MYTDQGTSSHQEKEFNTSYGIGDYGGGKEGQDLQPKGSSDRMGKISRYRLFVQKKKKKPTLYVTTKGGFQDEEVLHVIMSIFTYTNEEIETITWPIERLSLHPNYTCLG